MCFFFSFLFFLCCSSVFSLQITNHDKWVKVAISQHQTIVNLPCKRGLFYSNASLKVGHPELIVPFVIDVPKFHLYADPRSIPDSLKKEISHKIASFLHLSPAETDKLFVQLEKKSRSRKLILWITPEVQEEILQWWQRYARTKKLPGNALFFVQDYKRSYPFGSLLGQVLHTVREETDVTKRALIPTGGLELTLNNYLQGKEGRRLLLRSPRHTMDAGAMTSPPEDGADVYLTINHYLQAVAEEEIAKAVHKASAKGGWAILMDRTRERYGL